MEAAGSRRFLRGDFAADLFNSQIEISKRAEITPIFISYR
jgi:hypothetical protein